MEERLTSEADTEELARKISKIVKCGMSVGLVGELGAGKTTFVRYLVRHLGSEQDVSSPTFVLEHEYDLPGGVVVEHWDLYRLKALPEELHEPSQKNIIRLVEWADKVPEYLLSLDMVLEFKVVPTAGCEEQRIVVIRAQV